MSFNLLVTPSVLEPEHIPLTATRLTITFDMLPPRFVVEVVSPGRVGSDRDYARKRAHTIFLKM